MINMFKQQHPSATKYKKEPFFSSLKQGNSLKIYVAMGCKSSGGLPI